jgi:hypothetical protein
VLNSDLKEKAVREREKVRFYPERTINSKVQRARKHEVRNFEELGW